MKDLKPSVLPRIREKYHSIYTLTKEARSNPEPDHIYGLLGKREELLNAIEMDRTMLGEGGPVESERSIQGEIDAMIRSIQEYDAILMHVLQNDCDEIAGRLRSLNTTSHAALKYVGYSDRNFQRKR